MVATRKRSGFLAILALATAGSAVGFGPVALEPQHGPVGTLVTIGGDSFDPQGDYTVTLHGTALTVASITETAIEVTIPTGATSGFFVVGDGTQSIRSERAFILTRPMAVVYESELPPDFSDYDLGTLYSQATAGNESGFMLQVDTAGPSLVLANREGSGYPGLYGIARSGQETLILGAESTTEAFAFISSIVYTADETELAARLVHLRSQESFAEAVSAVSASLDAATDYLDSPAAMAALQEMINEFATTYEGLEPAAETFPHVAAEESRTGYDYSLGFYDLAGGYPRDLPRPPYAAIDRLIPKPDIQVPDRRGLPAWKIKFDAAPLDRTPGNDLVKRGLRQLTANPLDWTANLYALDVNDPLIDTPQKVADLTESDWQVVYDRLMDKPVDRLAVGATPAARYLDVLDVIKGQITDALTKTIVNSVEPDPRYSGLKEDLTVPTEVPGLFMIRTFSGASFPEQDDLIAMLPGGTDEDTRMKVLNVILAINDVLGFFVGQSNTIESREWAKFLLSLEKNIRGRLTSELSQGNVSSEFMVGLFWEMTRTASGWLVDQTENKLREVLGGVLQGRFSGLGKFVGSVLNVSQKGATVGKVIERITALTNASRLLSNNARIALAVEDTLVLVGNPWAPLVRSFAPTRGYQGSEVTLFGEGFSTEPGDIIVTIGRVSTDPENPPEPTRAEVLSSTLTSIQIRLPEDADTGIITVTVIGSGTGTTANNRDPYRNFVIIPDPVITEIIPADPVGGGSIILHGKDFPVDLPLRLRFSGSGLELVPDVASETEMFATIPATPGEQSVSLRLNGRTIGAFPIEVSAPPTPPEGLILSVTTNADGNARDDKLTLREAMLLANGTLSVTALTAPPEPPSMRPPGVTYETDSVSGDQLGPNSRNSIFVTLSDPIVLGQPLPSPTSFDIITRFEADASGLNSAALVLDGTVGADIDATILDAGADGIKLTGGARNNTGDLIVKDPQGHGVLLEDAAFNNRLRVAVSNPGGNAVYLSGENVVGNGIQIGLATGLQGPGAWGVVLDNGASYNRIGSQPGSSTVARTLSGFDSGGIRIDGEATRRNSIGRNFDFDDGFPLVVAGNGGPGLRLEGPGTRLVNLNIHGNDGHGIEVAGSTAAGSSIEGCRIGYDNTNGSASANLGSGIRIAPGSKDILVGSRVAVSESEVNSIGGNQDHGILVEGPGLERIRINAATIGTVYYGSQTPKALGNGIHGIALTGGASGVTVGDRNDRFRTFITHHVEGAGIYLAGTETRDNSISGAVIGRPDNLAVFSLGSGGAGNAIGIHITAGAHGTQVGIPGELVRSPEYDNGAIRPWNEIENNNVGIQIESGGDPSQTIPSDKNTPFAPRGANVVVNNRIGHIKDPQVFNDTDRGNAIGIVLTGNAAQNRIGGPGPAEGNLIHGSGSVGLLIQGVTHDRPELANRIIGNEFKGTGTLIENPVDPREGSITSAAILLHAGTANQIIGGNNPGEGNLITDGLIGIGLEGANANVITGNEIGGFRITGFPNSIFTQNRQAGIFLIASAGNRIGPGNTIAGNGRPDGPALGGIYLRLSSGNFIVGNTLGNLPVSQLRRNEPGNILVDNSPDNLIGLPGPDGPNVIGLGAGSGVHLFGALSYGNIIDSNFVGTDGNNAALANATEGILIDGDASANLVQNNTIFANGTDGVRISGLNTAENRLSLNSISGHTNGKGIRLEGSANSGIQPPELTTVNGFDLLGSAPAGTPDNSLVEVFHDPDDEGLIPFGLVTVRNEEFSFNAALNPGLTLTATLTDPDGNTSEFSSVLTLSTNKLSTLDLRRREGAPEERSAPANPVALAILPMVLTAPPDFAAAVESVTFEASGSIDESADLQGLALFRDEDDDGLLTSRDTMISPVGTIDVDDGEVTLTPDATLQAGSRESWLLAAIPKNGIAPGSTLIFRLVSAENVASRVFSSNAAISETGVFPIVSDTVTLIEPVDAYDQWREDTFSPEDAANDAVSGRNADPDEDGIPNLLEFALGTNPGDPDPWNNAQISLAGDHYVFQIPTDVSMADSTVLAEASSDLVAWSSGQEVADLVGMMEDGIGGFLVVVKVPLPLDEATPVFVRLVFESAGP